MDFVLECIAVPLSAEVQMTLPQLSKLVVWMLCDNEGILSCLCYHLDRWGVEHRVASRAEEAEEQWGPGVVLLVDLDCFEVPPNILMLPQRRFLFLCSDHRRRALVAENNVGKLCSDYAIIIKPLKRMALWQALLRCKFHDDSPEPTALMRQQQLFHHRTLAPIPSVPLALPVDRRTRILVAEDNSVNVLVGGD